MNVEQNCMLLTLLYSGVIVFLTGVVTWRVAKGQWDTKEIIDILTVPLFLDILAGLMLYWWLR